MISDTMSHVLDRYGATLARLERSRNRWSVVAVAGVAVGVTGATLTAVMSLTSGNLKDRLADTTDHAVRANVALADAERRIGDLRVQVTTTERLADTWHRQASDTSDTVSHLTAELQLVQAERDSLLCQGDEAQALAYLATALR